MKDFENEIRGYVIFHLNNMGFNIMPEELDIYVQEFKKELNEDIGDYVHNFITEKHLDPKEHCKDCIYFPSAFRYPCLHNKPTIGCGKQTQSDVDDKMADRELEELKDKEDSNEIRK